MLVWRSGGLEVCGFFALPLTSPVSHREPKVQRLNGFGNILSIPPTQKTAAELEVLWGDLGVQAHRHTSELMAGVKAAPEGRN